MIRTLRRLALPAALLAVVAMPAQAQDIDISGQWEFTSEGRRGAQTQVFTFVQDGMTVTGSVEMTMGGRGGAGRAGGGAGAGAGAGATIEIQEGTLEGNVLTFKLVMGMGDRSFETVYTATIEGDTMTGTSTGTRGGETPFTAKRKEG